MNIEEELQKKTLYYDIMNLWLYETIEGNSVTEYLKKHGYNRIIVYGVAELGERLIQCIQRTDLELVCVIDMNKNKLGDFVLLQPFDEIPSADILIVTSEYYFEEIQEKMISKVKCPIVSITQLFTAAFNCRF